MFFGGGIGDMEFKEMKEDPQVIVDKLALLMKNSFGDALARFKK